MLKNVFKILTIILPILFSTPIWAQDFGIHIRAIYATEHDNFNLYGEEMHEFLIPIGETTKTMTTNDKNDKNDENDENTLNNIDLRDKLSISFKMLENKDKIEIIVVKKSLFQRDLFLMKDTLMIKDHQSKIIMIPNYGDLKLEF